MILIISICKERLHYYEFVKPIEDILRERNIEFKTIYYKKVVDKHLFNKKIKKIIICGTSLKDNEYLENLDYFNWIKFFKLNKPILGICGGMQAIGLIFESEIKEKQEIGFYKENFKKEFLGMKGDIEVYHLHNNYIYLPDNFEEFTGSEIPQAIKHKSKDIYGVLFHPEVRNKKIIHEFVKSGPVV